MFTFRKLWAEKKKKSDAHTWNSQSLAYDPPEEESSHSSFYFKTVAMIFYELEVVVSR